MDYKLGLLLAPNDEMAYRVIEADLRKEHV